MSDEQESMDLFGDMHPYNGRFEVFTRLPEKGVAEEQILSEMAYMSEQENSKWQNGQCSGTMYHGGMEHYAFLNKVFNMFSYVNILQRDLCPSGTKFEAEVLAMVGRMLHGDEVSKVDPMDEEAGAITSGGASRSAGRAARARIRAPQGLCRERAGCGGRDRREESADSHGLG